MLIAPPHQASPSVASIVASRLAYGAGQRGFGNARAVRRRQPAARFEVHREHLSPGPGRCREPALERATVDELHGDVDLALGHAHVEDDVFLGLHASVGPGKTVGARSKVSANSCVLATAAADSIIYGVPGRITRRVDAGTMAW